MPTLAHAPRFLTRTAWPATLALIALVCGVVGGGAMCALIELARFVAVHH